MPSQTRPSLVKNADSLLGHTGKPIARDIQLKEIRSCFPGKTSGVRPLHAWVYGSTGSGKTCCVRYLLNTEAKAAGVEPIYVNCRERFTFLAVVEHILNRVKPLRSPQRTREFQLSLLRQALQEKKAVIALDEIDVLKEQDVSDLLHHLCSFPQTSVIGIAPTRRPLLKLPEAVRSRLAPRQVLFPRYSPEEMKEILSNAMGMALKPKSWTEEALQKIMEYSFGDARRALTLLRHSVHRAEDAGEKVLQARNLEIQNFNHFSPHLEDKLASLSSHHRMLHDLACSKGPIPGTELENAYQELCKKRELKPVASRTISKYLEDLCRRRILGREHGRGTSGWIYRAAGASPGPKSGQPC